MKLLTDAIVLILKALISIGDFVLRGFELVKLVKHKLKIKRSKKRFKLKKTKSVDIFPGPIPNLLKFKYFVLGVFFSLVFFFAPTLFLVFLGNLPNPKNLTQAEFAQTTKIYDRNGVLMYQIYANQNRTLVSLNGIPQNLKNATIAIEDKDFYGNPGFNFGSIIRAMIANLKGEPLQGGSTITQQLIKSTLLTPERSLSRKVKEIILSFWADRIFSKDQILEMYFNTVPYGGTAWGVEAASQTYFGKSVGDLTLSESAFLAGMPKAPTTYYPYGEYPNRWRARQKEVLQKMAEGGFIKKDEMKKAEDENLSFLSPQTPINAAHFVFYVKDLLVKKYGLPAVEKGGLTVKTTLDLKIQQMAQNEVADEVERSLRFNLTNGAALITNPKNGEILAMVGSHDYEDSNGGNVNVTTSLRQPGSSIKVITYSAALQNGFTAATTINDSPVTFSAAPPYTPVNYDGRFHGVMTVRSALANSVNIPAVKTLQKIGIPVMVDQAKKMGITTWDNPGKYGLAITLGAVEVKMTDMATVYGTLANLGKRVDLNPIIKVSDQKGDLVFEKKDYPLRVIDEGVAFIISNILSDNNARALEFGANSPLKIPGFEVAVKTGTSDNIRDNWTIGYTPSILVAVWVGNNNGEPMSGIASGITGAAPIWHNIITELLKNSQKESFKAPSNVLGKTCLGRKEYFIKGTENSVNCVLPSPSPSPSKTPSQ